MSSGRPRSILRERTRAGAGLLAIVVFVAVGVLVASPGIASEPSPTPNFLASLAPDATLPPIVEQQLSALPAGTKIVDCLPGVPRLPEGLIVNRALGFYQARPGFHELGKGYCAEDPNATPVPMRIDNADKPTP